MNKTCLSLIQRADASHTIIDRPHSRSSFKYIALSWVVGYYSLRGLSYKTSSTLLRITLIGPRFLNFPLRDITFVLWTYNWLFTRTIHLLGYLWFMYPYLGKVSNTYSFFFNSLFIEPILYAVWNSLVATYLNRGFQRAIGGDQYFQIIICEIVNK